MRIAGIARSLIVVAFVGLLLVAAAAIYVRSLPTPSKDLGRGASVSTEQPASQVPVAAPVKLAPDEPATAPDEECLSHIAIVDGLPMTVERSASISSTVVVGTVTEVGPARWRTEGEKPVTEDHELTPDNVMRLVRISVEEQLAGATADELIVIWIPGGTIGCHNFSRSGIPSTIKPGDRFALFLDTTRPPLPSIVDVAQVVEMWPVEGDQVATAADGKLPISEVSARAAEELPKTP